MSDGLFRERKKLNITPTIFNTRDNLHTVYFPPVFILLRRKSGQVGEIQIQSLAHLFRWPVNLILLPCASLVCRGIAEVGFPSAQTRWWRRGPRAPEGRSLDGSPPPGCRRRLLPSLPGGERLPEALQVSAVWYSCVMGAGIYAVRVIREHCPSPAERTRCLVTVTVHPGPGWKLLLAPLTLGTQVPLPGPTLQ